MVFAQFFSTSQFQDVGGTNKRIHCYTRDLVGTLAMFLQIHFIIRVPVCDLSVLSEAVAEYLRPFSKGKENTQEETQLY